MRCGFDASWRSCAACLGPAMKHEKHKEATTQACFAVPPSTFAPSGSRLRLNWSVLEAVIDLPREISLEILCIPCRSLLVVTHPME